MAASFHANYSPDFVSAVLQSPYSISTRLALANHYIDLEYPDLAVGEAYLALLLIDEYEDEIGEWHDNVVHALESDVGLEKKDDILQELEFKTYSVLVNCLLTCDNLKSAAELCKRGLSKHAGNLELLRLHDSILAKVDDTNARVSEGISIEDFPDRGVVRRELYAWNTYEPDRYSDRAIRSLNENLKKVSPKLQIKVTELDDLTINSNMPEKIKQLGIFAVEDLQPGDLVLDELSFLTSTGRINDEYCDACSAHIDYANEQNAVACQDCEETIFCSESCASIAPSSYHRAVCGTDVSAIAKDVPPREAADALYFLLVTRAISMAETRDCHPLELEEVKFLWGDYSTRNSKLEHTNALESFGVTRDAFFDQSRSLPFSFKYHVLLPLHFLEKIDINPFTVQRYSTWVINTLFAKFRGVASARQAPDGSGKPEVGAIHPLWCIANHSCDPNVRWEWQGVMKFWVRKQEERVIWCVNETKNWKGIRAGEEILSHYCDIELPVKERREWAFGALGGFCRCERCLWEVQEES